MFDLQVNKYSFEEDFVENNHTYYVSSSKILVHNTCNLIKGQLYRLASEMLITRPNTKTWRYIVKEISNADFSEKGTKFQVRVETKAQADALLKEIMGGNIDKYKNPAKYTTKYDIGSKCFSKG